MCPTGPTFLSIIPASSPLLDAVTFREDGFQKFSGVFSGDEIVRAQEAIDLVLADIAEGTRRPDNITFLSNLREIQNLGVSITDKTDAPFIVGELAGWSAVLKDIILHERLWSLAEELLGSRNIVYHFSNLTRKAAVVGPNIGWHRDYPNHYICPAESKSFLRFLIPLEPMDAENGCTQAIPGTHELGDAEARRLKEAKEKNYDLTDAIDLEAGSGDVLAIHSLAVHGGGENRSGRHRNVIVAQYGVATEEWFAWNPEMFSGQSREKIFAA